MREVKSLRLLVTSRCPYRCFYCHKEGMKSFVPELLAPRDYRYPTNLFKINFGLEEVTLSGGDPFSRKDIWEIVRAVKKEKVF